MVSQFGIKSEVEMSNDQSKLNPDSNKELNTGLIKPVEQYFNESKLEVYPTQDDRKFLMTLRQASFALQCSEGNLRSHLNRHEDEFDSGTHTDVVAISDSIGRMQQRRMLTKRGLIRISMFVKSDVAKQFRQWVEDLIIDLDSKNKLLVDNSPGVSSQLQQFINNHNQYNVLRSVASNLAHENRYDTAIGVLESVLTLPDLEDHQLSQTYYGLCGYHMIMGDLEQALGYYEKIEKHHVDLHQWNTINEMLMKLVISRKNKSRTLFH